jgi:hypothetical protein
MHDFSVFLISIENPEISFLRPGAIEAADQVSTALTRRRAKRSKLKYFCDSIT